MCLQHVSLSIPSRILFVLLSIIYTVNCEAEHAITGGRSTFDPFAPPLSHESSKLENVRALEGLEPTAALRSPKWTCDGKTILSMHEAALEQISATGATPPKGEVEKFSKAFEQSINDIVDRNFSTINSARYLDTIYRRYAALPPAAHALYSAMGALQEDPALCSLASIYGKKFAALSNALSENKKAKLKKPCPKESPVRDEALFSLALSDDPDAHDLYRRLILLLPKDEKETLIQKMGSCPLMRLPEIKQNDLEVKQALAKLAPDALAHYAGTLSKGEKRDPFQEVLSTVLKQKSHGPETLPAEPPPINSDFSRPEESMPALMQVPALLNGGFKCEEPLPVSRWIAGRSLLETDAQLKATFVKLNQSSAQNELLAIAKNFRTLSLFEKVLHLDEVQRKYPFTPAAKTAALLCALMPDAEPGLRASYAKQFLKDSTEGEYKLLPAETRQALDELKLVSPVPELLRLSISDNPQEQDLARRMVLRWEKEETRQYLKNPKLNFCWLGTGSLNEEIVGGYDATLGPLKKEATSAAFYSLKSSSPLVRVRTIHYLSGRDELKDTFLSALLDMDEKDPDVRTTLMQTIKGMALFNPDVHSKLLAALKETDKAVPVINAADALASMGIKTVNEIPPFIELLKNGNPRVRLSAAEALGTVGFLPPPTMVSALTAAISDEDAQVRRSALNALSKLRDAQSAAPAIVKALKDPDSQTRSEAAHALGSLGLPTPAHAKALQALLKDPDSTVKAAAAVSLATMGGEAKTAVPTLIELLGDENMDVRNLVSRTLVIHIDTIPEALKPLLEATESPELKKRQMSLLTVGDIKRLPETSIPVLLKSVIHEDASIRETAIFAVASFMTEAKKAGATPALLKSLKDPHPQVRRAAVRALSDIEADDPKLVSKFVSLLGDEDSVANMASFELQRFIGMNQSAHKDRVIPALIKALESESATIRAGTLKTFLDLGQSSKVAVPELLVATKHKDATTRTAALLVLHQMGDTEEKFLLAFERGLGDPDGGVQDVAVVAFISRGRQHPIIKSRVEKLLLGPDERTKAGARVVLESLERLPPP